MNEVVGALHTDVPEEVRALRDAGRPLPPGVSFLPMRPEDAVGSGLRAWRILYVAGVMGAVYLVITARWLGASPGWQSWVSLQILPVPAILLVWRLWRGVPRRSGVPRDGVFLLPGHLAIFNGFRWAILARPGTATFAVRKHWNPLRRSWILRVTPAGGKAFEVEVDGRDAPFEQAAGLFAVGAAPRLGNPF